MNQEEKFDISKLYYSQENRNTLRLSVSREIVRRVHSRIELISNHGHRTDTSCIFEIPRYLVGFPIYDINVVASFVVETLSKEGFFIQRLTESQLLISWDKKYIEAFVKAQAPTTFVNNLLLQNNIPVSSSTPSLSAASPSSSTPKPHYQSTGRLFGDPSP